MCTRVYPSYGSLEGVALSIAALISLVHVTNAVWPDNTVQYNCLSVQKETFGVLLHQKILPENVTFQVEVINLIFQYFPDEASFMCSFDNRLASRFYLATCEHIAPSVPDLLFKGWLLLSLPPKGF